MVTIAVFASGYGSNLQAIIDAIESKQLDARIAIVFSDKKEAFALERAKKHSIPTLYLSAKEFPSREEHEKKIIEHLDPLGVELIVLAGYMRILSPYIIGRYPLRIINIHPALLPSFPGTHGIKDAFDYGVKYTGVTVHFVDEGVDTGPIIAQEVVRIDDNDTLETLELKIHAIEHRLYPQVIQWYSENRIRVDGRKVRIVSP
ncbi:MAG: phosphoribosylglycinamide formyltransferase [bacterium]|nr:phosphoribosylglycinamide formyltransferase [bacterium]